MKQQIVKILDRSCNVVAIAQVAAHGQRFSGSIDLSPMPVSLRKKFEEYEQIVNEQAFSLLDAIETQISNLIPKVILEGGAEVAVEDLQIYPVSRRVSFSIATEPARRTAQANT